MFDGNESAKALKEKSRKTVTLPESQVAFLIRKLIPRDFVSKIVAANAGLDIPSSGIAPAPGETEDRARVRARARAMQNNPETIKAIAETILGKGVLAPKIMLEDTVVAGDGEVNAWDIPEKDIEWLIMQIIEFSGLGAEAQAVESFLESKAKDDGSPRRSSAEVRDGTA